MAAVPWRLIGTVVGVALIAGFLWWAQGRIRISYIAERERDTAIATHASYKELVTANAIRAIARMERDQTDDAAMAARITQLTNENAELARLAAGVPATVEKPDANGVPRLAINDLWWLCNSAILTRDPADAAACKARAGAGAPEH